MTFSLITGPLSVGLTIFASNGNNDCIYGRGGNDRTFSGRGHDIADGGDGRDRIWSGQGHDERINGEVQFSCEN